MVKMKKWAKIFITTLIGLMLILGLNEILLTKANHLRSIVSDADLWAIEREKVNDLSNKDILLLGASRMQVDLDLDVMHEYFPEKKIIQLALSGLGCSFPVFKDLVENTGFDGIVLIDETQMSLAKTNSDQQKVIDHYYHKYSWDRKANKLLSMNLQQSFLFLNPNSNSERLWGNLLGKQELPPPMFTITYPSREQTSYFDLTDTRWIYQMRIEGISAQVKIPPPGISKWVNQVQTWKPWLRRFEERGGRVIFVHLPNSEERWQMENTWMSKDQYWDHAMEDLTVESIHFADYDQLRDFELPDTSHLNAESKTGFTKAFSLILKRLLS